MNNTKYIGEKTEYLIIAELYKLDYIILKPLGDNLRYDLLLDTQYGFIKCQCKTSRFNKNYIEFNTASNSSNTKKSYKTNYIGTCDYFLTFSQNLNSAYFYPVGIASTSTLRLRIEKTKNNQQNNVKYAELFKLEYFSDYIKNSMSAKKEIF